MISTYFINTEHEGTKMYFDVVDWIFNMVFTLEAGLKIIKSGFVICKNSYLRDTWNQIDFTIVLAG